MKPDVRAVFVQRRNFSGLKSRPYESEDRDTAYHKGEDTAKPILPYSGSHPFRLLAPQYRATKTALVNRDISASLGRNKFVSAIKSTHNSGNSIIVV